MPTNDTFSIVPLCEEDAALVRSIAENQWGGNLVVVHNTEYFLDQLPGFKAQQALTWIGLVTYHIANEICEIVSLDSFVPKLGVGRKLVEAVIAEARQANCTKIVLITTNDNVNAMGFYQRIGFQMVWVEPDAVTRSREIKPSIPLIAGNRLPIRDEITFEMTL